MDRDVGDWHVIRDWDQGLEMCTLLWFYSVAEKTKGVMALLLCRNIASFIYN